MKFRALCLLLLTPFAFGQKFQDVSAKGAPTSLSIKNDYPDLGPYLAVRNTSHKNILALIALVSTKDDRGMSSGCHGRMDYAFKSGVLAPQDERGACSVNGASEGAKVLEAIAAVLFVQFDDGSTWGDPTADENAGVNLLAARAQKLAFLKHLVEAYYESGEDAFQVALAKGMANVSERSVAMCLVGDAKDRKIGTIDLAKERLAAAQGWHASGIF